jgi:hypothetical protein
MLPVAIKGRDIIDRIKQLCLPGNQIIRDRNMIC